MLNDDSYQTGTSESPLCDCGLERESAEHFLLKCNRYRHIRDVMFQTVNAVWMSTQQKRRLIVSEQLLLAPMWDDRLTRKDDKLIKDALFQFLADANRKL